MRLLSSASVVFGSLVWAASITAQVGDLRLVEELRLGRIEGSESDMFSDIHDLTVDGDGRIYVIDPGMQNVRVFGPRWTARSDDRLRGRRSRRTSSPPHVVRGSHQRDMGSAPWVAVDR